MKQLKKHFYGIFFRICRRIVRTFYPKYSVQTPFNPGPVVYITHHQNLFGPFILLLWFTECIHAWILHVFLDRKACYDQYVNYTFTKRYGWNRTLAVICAYFISSFVSKLLHSCQGIPVYRGSRQIVNTFKQSAEALSNGESIAIFPDTDYSDRSSEMKEMYEGFLSIEKYYFKTSGEHVCFVPLYVSKNKRKIIGDKQIYFRDGKSFKEEKQIVYEQILAELHRLAVECGDVKHDGKG